MGLLDNPDTAGNLSLAAGLLGGGNFGQAMQRGLMGYQDTSNTIQDRALKRQAQEIAIQQNAAQLKDMLWKRQMGNSILGLDGNGGQAATVTDAAKVRPMSISPAAICSGLSMLSGRSMYWTPVNPSSHRNCSAT